jgi:hypothetical protein
VRNRGNPGNWLRESDSYGYTVHADGPDLPLLIPAESATWQKVGQRNQLVRLRRCVVFFSESYPETTKLHVVSHLPRFFPHLPLFYAFRATQCKTLKIKYMTVCNLVTASLSAVVYPWIGYTAVAAPGRGRTPTVRHVHGADSTLPAGPIWTFPHCTMYIHRCDYPVVRDDLPCLGVGHT